MRTGARVWGVFGASDTTLSASAVRFDLLKSKKTMKVFTAAGGGAGGGGGGGGGGGASATPSSDHGYHRNPAITTCSFSERLCNGPRTSSLSACCRSRK